MKPEFILESLDDKTLTTILSLPPANKLSYFDALVKNFYPHIDPASAEFTQLRACYISSFYTEKLYRSNKFFHENFTVVYTETGLIRDIVLDIYYSDEHLITH